MLRSENFNIYPVETADIILNLTFFHSDALLPKDNMLEQMSLLKLKRVDQNSLIILRIKMV